MMIESMKKEVAEYETAQAEADNTSD